VSGAGSSAAAASGVGGPGTLGELLEPAKRKADELVDRRGAAAGSQRGGSKESWYPYFMLTKKTSKNQITLPKRIVEQFPAVDYFEVTAEAGKIVLRPVDVDPLARVREKLAELGLDDDDIRAAVAWARRTDE
jgi:hypothetical protein